MVSAPLVLNVLLHVKRHYRSRATTLRASEAAA
jgi:hypothetical protein